MTGAVTIYAGGHVHPSTLGNVHLDRQLRPSIVNALVAEMIRQGVELNSVMSATIYGEGERVVFHLYEAQDD